jgi:hypothetical protein
MNERNAVEATTELMLSMVATLLDAKILTQAQVFVMMESALGRLENPASQEFLQQYIIDRIAQNPKWNGGQ